MSSNRSENSSFAAILFRTVDDIRMPHFESRRGWYLKRFGLARQRFFILIITSAIDLSLLNGHFHKLLDIFIKVYVEENNPKYLPFKSEISQQAKLRTRRTKQKETNEQKD